MSHLSRLFSTQGKCARYWPEVEEEKTYGCITVSNLSESTTVDYTLRAFNVKKKGATEERKIYHFHFRVGIGKENDTSQRPIPVAGYGDKTLVAELLDK